MNLLKHKSWHTGSLKNRQVVARDEAEARTKADRLRQKEAENVASAIREEGHDRNELFLSFLSAPPPVRLPKAHPRAVVPREDTRRQREHERLLSADPMTAVAARKRAYRRQRFADALETGPDEEMMEVFARWERDLPAMRTYVLSVGREVVECVRRHAPALYLGYVEAYEEC